MIRTEHRFQELRQLLKSLKFDMINGMKAPLCVIAAIIGVIVANAAEKSAGTGLSFKGPLGLQM